MVNDEIKFVIYNNNITLEPGKISISSEGILVYESDISEYTHDYINYIFKSTDGDVVKVPKFTLKKCSIKLDNE
jgi:hypothetical protein